MPALGILGLPGGQLEVLGADGEELVVPLLGREVLTDDDAHLLELAGFALGRQGDKPHRGLQILVVGRCQTDGGDRRLIELIGREPHVVRVGHLLEDLLITVVVTRWMAEA